MLFRSPKLDTYYIKTTEGYFDAKTDELLIDYDPSNYVRARVNKTDSEDVTKHYDYYFGGFSSYEIPHFYSYSNYTEEENVCANVAGTIMLNFWNKVNNNGIVNERNLDYQGNFTDEAATNYEKAFYTYMKTGTFGTTPKNCAEGFKKFVTDWGHNCDIINLSDSTYENSIGWLKKNVPFFVTAKNYYFTSGNSKYLEDVSLPQTGRDPQILKIEYSYYEGLSQTHCFVTIGYGYYYLTNIINNTTINKYNINFYKILDGWGQMRYFNIADSETIAVYGIKVSM